MTRRLRCTGEGGYSLMIVIVALVFLSALAMMTVQAVSTESHVAGNDRAANNALYIAQAGIAWGTDVLRQAPYNVTDSASVTAVLQAGLTPITGTGESVLDGWLELPGSPVAYSGGTYRVAVKDDVDDADPTTDANSRLLMRALGTDGSGSRRLVEVVLSVP
jgi:Tfp pilus assembly protein PilX